MYDNEEFAEGTYCIRAPHASNKIAGHILVTVSGGVRTEEWNLVTSASGNDNTFANFTWLSQAAPDLSYQFERVTNPPNYGSLSTDTWRHTTQKL